MALAYVIVILLVATLAQVTKTGPIRSSPTKFSPTHMRKRAILNQPDNGGQESSDVQHELVSLFLMRVQ